MRLRLWGLPHRPQRLRAVALVHKLNDILIKNVINSSGLNTDEEASQIVQLTTLDVEAMFLSLCEGSGFRV